MISISSSTCSMIGIEFIIKHGRIAPKGNKEPGLSIFTCLIPRKTRKTDNSIFLKQFIITTIK